jgi:hypothetical protein
MAKLWLADKDPVVPEPTVDGNTGIIDPGVTFPPNEPGEAGYTDGARVSWVSGSVLPQIILQGVKRTDGDFISLGFFVRFDRQFDTDDAIVIALQKSFGGTSQADCRRIDIYPLTAGGAGPGQQGSPPDVRTGQNARNVEYRTGQGGSSWTQLIPPGQPNSTIKGFQFGVRSWQPTSIPQECAWSVEVKIPTTTNEGGSGWLDLSASFGLYVSVVRAMGQFPGSTAPVLNQFVWPPSSPPLTGDLDNSTNIPFSSYGEAVIASLLPPPPQPNPNPGVKFVNGELSIGVLKPDGSISHQIDGNVANTLIARVENDSPNASGDAPRVTAEFRLANWGLGPGAPAAWTKITMPPGSGPNPTTPVDIPHGVTQRDLTTQWTLDPNQRTTYAAWPHQCFTVQLDTEGFRRLRVTGATNTAPITITTADPHSLANGNRVLVTDVVGNTGANNTALRPDWIIQNVTATTFQLTGSSGTGAYQSGGLVTPITTRPVEFAESSMRRNMDFINLSSLDRPAEVSGVGYPGPPGGQVHHNFLLLVDVRKFMVPPLGDGDDGDGKGGGGGGPINVAAIGTHGEGERLLPTWTWIVHGYRDTGQTLRVQGTRYRIFDPTPGAFGYVAQHDGPESHELSFDLSGGGIQRHAEHSYTLPVPDGGAVTINTRVEAGPPRRRRGLLWWLLQLLRRLFEWLRRLFGR